MTTFPLAQHRQDAIEWAKSMLALPGFRIVDTETTGLGQTDEIISIGIVDDQGCVLLDTLVKPTKPIPPDATRIHGITNRDVASAPTFPQVYTEIVRLLRDQIVIIYNLEYDARRIQYGCTRHCLPAIGPRGTHCAMLRYARFHGEWSTYWNDYQWQKLAAACAGLDIKVQHAHSAVGDCLMTLELIRRMAEA